MESLPERAARRPHVLHYLAALALGSVALVGYVFWDIVSGWVYGLGDSLSYVVSRLNPAPLFERLLLTKIEFFYLTAMAFAVLLVVGGVIWFARYYWKPFRYTSRPH